MDTEGLCPEKPIGWSLAETATCFVMDSLLSVKALEAI